MNLSRLSRELDDAGVSIVLLGGLPGSGKSTYAKSLVEKGKGWLLYDDFQSRAHNDSARFCDSRYFPELLQSVRQGSKCIVADIRFVYSEYQVDAQQVMREEFGNIGVRLHLFENDPVQCSQNVRESLDRNAEARLDAIKFWSRLYTCPPGTLTIPVWRRPQ